MVYGRHQPVTNFKIYGQGVNGVWKVIVCYKFLTYGQEGKWCIEGNSVTNF